MTTSEQLTIAGILLGLISSGVSMWVGLRIALAKQQVKIENLEKNHDMMNIVIDKIFKELKEIRNMLNEKVDRK